MDSQDMDRLLEQSLGGESPRPIFRARLLRDSTAAFVRARRRWAHRRLTALSTAAFIAAVSFLLGRSSAPRSPMEPTLANAGDTVVVPGELVVCLDAARLFRQLGMEDRMNRAIDCASRLLPREATATDRARKLPSVAGGGGIERRSGHEGASSMPGSHQSEDSVNRILAGSFGDYHHASSRD